MNKADLEAKCKEWQEVIGLADWTIDIDFEPTLAWANSDDWGNAIVTAEMRTAVIRIAPLDHADPDDPNTPKLDYLILHELMHCWVNPLMSERDREERGMKILLEQAVDSLAQAVLKGWME